MRCITTEQLSSFVVVQLIFLQLPSSLFDNFLHNFIPFGTIVSKKDYELLSGLEDDDGDMDKMKEIDNMESMYETSNEPHLSEIKY